MKNFGNKNDFCLYDNHMSEHGRLVWWLHTELNSCQAFVGNGQMLVVFGSATLHPNIWNLRIAKGNLTITNKTVIFCKTCVIIILVISSSFCMFITNGVHNYRA